MSLKIKKSEMCFFIGLFCIIINSFMRDTMIINFTDKSIDIVYFIGILFLCFNIIFASLSIKQYFIIAIIMLVTILAYWNSKQTLILTMVFLIISSHNIEINKAVKFSYFVSLYILLFHIFLYIIEYIFDFQSVIFIVRNGVKRYSFLFNHPNTFSLYFVWIVYMRYYLNYDKLKGIDIIMLFVYAIFLYCFPNSRTSVICLILSIILIVLEKVKGMHENTFLMKGLRNVFIICAIFSILAMVFYNISIVQKIDKFFSGRIVLSRAVLEIYGISFLGQNMKFNQKIEYIEKFKLNSLTLDSVYYSLIFIYGIVSFIIFIYLTNKTMKEQRENKNIIFLVIFAIYGLMETFPMNAAFAFPLLFVGKLLKGEKSNDEKSINNYTCI